MAHGLKSTGRRELGALRKRVTRQLSLERISRADHDYIIHRLDEVDAKIVSMIEDGEEEEVKPPW